MVSSFTGFSWADEESLGKPARLRLKISWRLLHIGLIFIKIDRISTDFTQSES